MSIKKGAKKEDKSPDRTDTSLGERLHSVRIKNNLTLGEFAKSLGKKSGSYFSDLENAEKSNPSTELIIKICKTYNICHKWLLTGIGVMTYPAIIQNTDKEKAKKKPAEEIRMMGNQIIEILEIITRLKIRVEHLEAQLQGEQKKNHSGS